MGNLVWISLDFLVLKDEEIFIHFKNKIERFQNGPLTLATILTMIELVFHPLALIISNNGSTFL